MKAALKLVPIAAMLALGSSIPLSAQGIGVGMKFGAGPVIGSMGTQGARASVNLALTAEYGLSAKNEVFAELGYRSFRASEYEATRFGTGYTPTGTTGFIVPNYPYASGLRPGSVDIRKDNLEGFTLNLGYRQQIGDTGFRFQGGLTLAALKSKQDVTGMIEVLQTIPPPTNTGSATVLFREGLSFTPSKTALRPGAFVGMQYRFSESFYIESNVSMVGYDQVNYVPLAYTGQPAHSESAKKSKVVLDLNCGFRF